MIRWFIVALAALPRTAASAQSPIERGGYLVNTIGVCGNCHSPRGGDPKSFGGGTNVFNTPSYTVKGNNLTPHPEAGIGKFSDAELKVLLTQGKRPNGELLAPNMPYNLLGIMTPGDLDAIVAYLRSLPPLPTAVDPPVYRTEDQAAPAVPAGRQADVRGGAQRSGEARPLSRRRRSLRRLPFAAGRGRRGLWSRWLRRRRAEIRPAADGDRG